MKDRPQAARQRAHKHRRKLALDIVWATSLDAEIARGKRDYAIRRARRLGIPLRVIARAAHLSHETIRRLAEARK